LCIGVPQGRLKIAQDEILGYEWKDHTVP
jgi:hypothetical protein